MTRPEAPYQERGLRSIGSGSVFARGPLKNLYVDDMPVRDVVLACIHALYDAADDDSATGGPGPELADLPGHRHGHRAVASSRARRTSSGTGRRPR